MVTAASPQRTAGLRATTDRRSRCNREPKRPRAKSADNQVNLPINPPPDDGTLVRSGMPIPGCVVRRFLRRQSYAQLAWFVNRVQCSRRLGGSRDQNRPVALGGMPVGKSERSSQRQGFARTVMLMPGHAARVCGDRRGKGVLTLGSGVLPLSASVRTRVISRPE